MSYQFGGYLQNSQFLLSRGSYEMVKLATFFNNSTISPNWTFMGFLENVGAEASWVQIQSQEVYVITMHCGDINTVESANIFLT